MEENRVVRAVVVAVICFESIADTQRMTIAVVIVTVLASLEVLAEFQ